jgi:hypothetical protein
MMVGVALVATNLALGRAVSAALPGALLPCAGPVVLLQVAAWRAWRDRRPGRAFWVGYLLVGGLVTGALVLSLVGSGLGRWPMLSWRRSGTAPYADLAVFWSGAMRASHDGARAAAGLWLGPGPRPDLAGAAALATACGPQVGAGVLGGWIGRSLVLRRRRSRVAAAGLAAGMGP